MLIRFNRCTAFLSRNLINGLPELSNRIFIASDPAGWLVLPLLLVSLASCDIPKDPEQTLERVRSSGSFRVGLVSREGEPDGRQQRFLAKVAEGTGASPDIRKGVAEDLLAKVEDGELDLVVGEFHSSSPWKDRVTFVPPLDELAPGEERLVMAAAAQNGENAWIGFLHRISRSLGGDR
jgi:polar amino acid transport system substrate-binding protein